MVACYVTASIKKGRAMSIKSQDGFWHVDFAVKGAGRVRRSSGLESTQANKPAAQEWHDQIKAALWRRVKLGEKPQKIWEVAVLQWCEEKSHKKSFQGDLAMFRWLSPHLDGLTLEDISRDLVDRILKIKESESSPSRANRYAALVRSVLRKAAREWTDGRHAWLERAPAIRMRPEPSHRVRWLTYNRAGQLLEALPTHLRMAAAFTLQTGLRSSNCATLKWVQTDLGRKVMWVYGDEAKGKKSIGVPLNSAAMKVLTEAKRTNKQSAFVFEYKGKPLTRFNNSAWRKALKRVGINNFRWHDLRHTWASWHVQSGTSLHALKILGGWQTLAMVQVYAHLAPEHMAVDAERIAKEFKS